MDRAKMHVLFASAEAVPFAKVGGLGDVVGVLPQVIQDLDPENLDVRLLLPFHASVKTLNPPRQKIGDFEFTANTNIIRCELFVSQLGKLPVYLVDNDQINHNSPVYHGDWALDGLKYASFSLAILEAARYLDWHIDLLHANDWHTALSVYALRSIYKDDPFFAGTKAVLSVHNLPFNGYGSQSAMSALGFEPSEDEDLPDWARFTPLPLGISSADKVIAVSSGYAKEILTPEFGCGMDGYLRLHQDKVMGIINGIDTNSWDPANDTRIPHPYSMMDLAGKTETKAEFQQHAGFVVDADIPLLTTVSRIDRQKGIDLIFEGLAGLTSKPWQLAILGTGDPLLEQKARDLSSQHPERAVAFLRYDDTLARLLYASGDIFLMPSLYEPCGLSQMIAMRYGNLPLATATGGLQDTIVDYPADAENATGFLFTDKSVDGFVSRLDDVLTVFQDKPTWLAIQQNAMKSDFSWPISAAKYLAVYRSLVA